MKKLFRVIVRKLDTIARDFFASYLVLDCHGTDKLCWSMAEAQSWLPYCSNNAKIVDTYDYKMIVARKQKV